MVNDLWKATDVMVYCFNRMEELRNEEPVNQAAIKRYSDDIHAISRGTETYTVSTCEMLKDIIKTTLVKLQDFCDANPENRVFPQVSEAVRSAEKFCESQDPEGGANVVGKTVGRTAEKYLKRMKELEVVVEMAHDLMVKKGREARSGSEMGVARRASSMPESEDMRRCRRCPERP